MNSYAAELHLGEYKNQGNKRNFQRKKDGTDLREKFNRKRDRDYRKESDTKNLTRKNINAIAAENFDTSGLNAARGRSQMTGRVILMTKTAARVTNPLKVYLMLMFVQKLYLLVLLFSTVGWLIQGQHHT